MPAWPNDKNQHPPKFPEGEAILRKRRASFAFRSLLILLDNCHAIMAHQDSDSELEAKICQALTYSTPQPAKDNQAPVSKKGIRKRKRRTARDLDKSADDDLRSLKETIAEAEKRAEERAKKLVLVRPKQNAPRSNLKPAGKKKGIPAVVIAGELNDKAPPKWKNERSNEGGKDDVESIDARQFVEQHRSEIGQFGSRGLHKRDRKQYETAHLVKLGCRRPKNQKMPIGVLVKKRRYQNIREQKKKDMDIATGMLVRTKRKR